MATITRYTVGTGTAWEVRYRTPQGATTRRRGFRTKALATQFAATVEVEKLTGGYVAPSLGRIALGELGPEWLAMKEADVKPASYRVIEVAWRVHVEPKWGTTRICDIDRVDVEAWIREMNRASGATTVIRNYGVLRGVLDHAVDKKRLTANPAKGVKNLPKKIAKQRTYLDHQQVDALATAAGDHSTLVLTLAYSGLRWGEAIGLRVKNLDLLRKRINVVENAVWVAGTRQPKVGTPKSWEQRAVPVSKFLVTLLAKQCEGKSRDDLVFPDASGGYLKRPAPQTWWPRAVKSSGVPALTPHDLRHTAASLAISAGANVLAVSRMLGHKDPSVTLVTYADLFDSDLDAVADVLEKQRVQSVSTGT